ILWQPIVTDSFPCNDVNRFSNTDQCEPYIFPYCPELDFNLWRSPRTKQECELYCYSLDEQRKRGII
uniref:BPTI/Kunitz inhibitor domain-containing protein n=1 Tax=Parascaris univalens TaxID=6257 RepID=A0A915B4A5_PARUN